MYDDIDRDDIDAGELHALFQKEWWTEDRRLSDVERMLARCELSYGIAAARSGKLVAFSRALTDGIFKALIFDVIVDGAHRGRALGDRLMSRMIEDRRLERVAHIELYCRPELEPFYARYGFSRDNGGVGLMRRITARHSPRSH